MIKRENMRNELRHYLQKTLRRYEVLFHDDGAATDYKAAWHDQKYAIDFVVEDIDIIGDGPPCIGILLYDIQEVNAVEEVGRNFLDFYLIGQSGDYKAAFQSSKWYDVYVSAKTALELILRNDANPPG
jgi:hypothetical protein